MDEAKDQKCGRCGLPPGLTKKCACGDPAFELGALAGAVDAFLRGICDRGYLAEAFKDLIDHDETIRKALA